jgi:tRNA(Ile)-lysidine synthase
VTGERVGFELVEATRATIARAGMLRGGETVVVALSGGPDSTCLVDVLARARLDLALVVAHVDHGLGPGSSDVAARLARWAAEQGHDVHVVRARDLAGPNLQARARSFRYSFFDTVAQAVGAARIATGHTLDDRVETTLARLLHGAPAEGLASIPAVEGPRIRPLIEARRAETRSYCDARGLVYSDDRANEDVRFERVAVRRKLVAAIEEHWGDGAVRAVAASAARLREDAEAFGALADRLYADLAVGEESEPSLNLEALRALPRALRRRLLERAVGRVRDRSGGIEAALDALEQPVARPRSFAVASGAEIVLERDAVRIRRASREHGAATPIELDDHD